MSNIYYKNESNGFAPFIEKYQGKKIVFVSDFNTRKFAIELMQEFEKSVCKEIYFGNKNLVPDEEAIEKVKNDSIGFDLIMCVGSGSLNDVCKYVSRENNIPCATLPTACSMDGYLSKGSALMIKNKKVTLDANPPIAILVNTEVLKTAPREMTAAGFGDIIGKYTALTDWHLSNIINNEEINKKAYALMEKALFDVVNSYDSLLKNDDDSIRKLIDALLVAGTSMAICGNSRPASGSEHHISHYLEMDFNNRGLVIPPHGVKVAMGTLVSIDLYNNLLHTNFSFTEKLKEYIEKLPSTEKLEKMLNNIGCPTHFSDIDVNEELLKRTLLNAYKVRDRYTILTLYSLNNLWTDDIVNNIIKKHL